jgi:hypothetical protein
LNPPVAAIDDMLPAYALIRRRWLARIARGVR